MARNIWRAITASIYLQLACGSLQTVTINQVGYQFSAPTIVNGVQYNYMIDTGNYQFSSNVDTRPYNATTTDTACLSLFNDQTAIQYFPNNNCSTTYAQVFIGTAARATVAITPDLALAVQNPLLHQWNETNGDIGMGYYICSYPCTKTTAFQAIVQDVSLKTFSSYKIDGILYYNVTYYDLVFGLDFNPSSSPFLSVSSQPSTMQMGGVKHSYTNDMIWSTQSSPVGYLAYHEFYLQNFEMCDANVLFPFGQNWQVIVDTGCACMIFPEEVYDSIMSYFDNSTVFIDTELVHMPAFSFNTQFTSAGENTTFYIPFSNLIVNASDIDSAEEGAPLVNIQNSVTGEITQFRLCMLRGDSMVDEYTGEYTSAPLITLGSMALSTIYFAADFNAGSVGLANKLNNTEISYFNATSVKGCKPVAQCVGDQVYKQEYNYCKDPRCDYFFVDLDSETHTCVWKVGDLGFGLFVILSIILLEVVSYFVMQYSAYTSVTQSNRDRHSTWFLAKKGLDPLTLLIGRFICWFVDPILIALKWVPTATVAAQRESNGGGGGAAAVAGGARGVNLQALGNRAGGPRRVQL